MKKKKWTFPAEPERSGDSQSREAWAARKANRVRQTELEYKIPEGSDAMKEVAKCVQYCKEALA